LSLGEYVRLNQRFVDLFAHKKSKVIRTPTVEQKEFNFDAQIDTLKDIHIKDEDSDLIDDLFNDLKVVWF
jgi:hypothetical protein